MKLNDEGGVIWVNDEHPLNVLLHSFGTFQVIFKVFIPTKALFPIRVIKEFLFEAMMIIIASNNNLSLE